MTFIPTVTATSVMCALLLVTMPAQAIVGSTATGDEHMLHKPVVTGIWSQHKRSMDGDVAFGFPHAVVLAASCDSICDHRDARARRELGQKGKYGLEIQSQSTVL